MPSKSNTGRKNAKERWSSVKKITTSIDGLLDSENTNQKTVKHGIYQTIRLDTESRIRSVTHNLYSGQYIILYEEGRIEAFLKDGSKDVVKLKEPIDGLVYASKPKVYLTWQSDKIKVKISRFLSCFFFAEQPP